MLHLFPGDQSAADLGSGAAIVAGNAGLRRGGAAYGSISGPVTPE